MDLTQKILSDYSYYLKIERAMSPNTVEAYTSDLEGFFNYVGVEPAHQLVGSFQSDVSPFHR